ncbi:MAG: Ig-like domain-containing protein, partial [Acidobacteriota bacterium]|nr:Ig-like domain-containing protein [Acidobacteriota bacterium]
MLLDVDNDAASGCTVSGMPGVDQVFVTRVATDDTSGTVSRTFRQVCANNALGSAIDIDNGGWPAGFVPASGNVLVESRIPFAAFGSARPSNMRVGIEASQGAAVHTAILRPDGTMITYPGPRIGKRRSTASPGNARVITLDGIGDDWTGLSILVDGIASSGNSALRIIRLYAFSDSETDNLYFRFDANLSNSAPFAQDDRYTRPAGKPLSVATPGVLANDGDPNGQPLTATPVSPAAHGNVTLNPDGSFTYTPNDPASTENDAFEYKATNGTKDSNAARVRISVATGSNSAPVATDDAYNTNEDAPLNVAAPGVTQNDSDADSDPLTVAIVAPGPSHGTVVLAPNGGFTYSPAPNFFGTDTFSYTINDGKSTDTATVTITIASVNDAPVVKPATITIAENLAAGAVVGTVKVNDVDTADSHTFSILSGNTNSAFAINAATGVITVATPSALNFETTPQFVLSVRARDNGVPQLSDIANITINLTDANDAPLAVNGTQTVLEDGTLNVAVPGVLAGSSDEDGNALTASVVTDVQHGTLTLNPNGSYLYVPAPNFNGTDSFTFRLYDQNAYSNNATVTITVTPVNDAPSFAAGNNVNAFEDSGAFSGPWATSILAGPADEQGVQTLTFDVTNNNGALFAVAPALSPSGVLTFTPAPNSVGTANVTVTLRDNGSSTAPNANLSSPTIFTITINAVNDAPSFVKGADQSVGEDSPAQTVGAWASGMLAGPADETGQLLTFNVSNNNNGLFNVQPAIAPNGTLTYAPAPNASGVATVTVTLSDNGGTANGGSNTSAPQIFTITITGVNDAPINNMPGAQSSFEDMPFTFSAGKGNALSISDVDAGTSNVQTTIDVVSGTVAVAPASGANVTGDGTAHVVIAGTIAQINSALNGLTFTPALNVTTTAQLTLTTTDLGNSGSGGALQDVDNVTITLTAINDAPVFTKGADVMVLEDSAPYNLAWANGISAGPADEVAQTVTFTVSNDKNSLFSVQPAISPAGVLT